MKRLFDENEKYTPMALELDNRCHLALEKVVKEYVDDGYSLRDINLLLHYAVDSIMLQELL